MLAKMKAINVGPKRKQKGPFGKCLNLYEMPKPESFSFMTTNGVIKGKKCTRSQRNTRGSTRGSNSRVGGPRDQHPWERALQSPVGSTRRSNWLKRRWKNKWREKSCSQMGTNYGRYF